MPRVLRIINRFNLGGPTYNATFLTRFLSPSFETLLIGGVHDEGETDSLHITRSYGIEPVVMRHMRRSLNPLSDIRTFVQMVRLIRSFKPDIVHTHAAKAGALGRIAAWYCGVPVIVHTYHGHVFHSYFSPLTSRVVRSVERLLGKLTTVIVTISQKQYEEIVTTHRICPPHKATIVPLGFDLSRFYEKRQTERSTMRSQLKLSDQDIGIAIIGRLAPIKNHSLFLDALSRMKSGWQNCTIFIVGDGAEREKIEGFVAQLPDALKGRITFTSWILDIATFNAAMDIICLTSDNEGTPVSLIEAQASGVAVISTDVGGVSDIIKNGITGFIVPPNAPDLFAVKLDELTTNHALRRKMGENGWDNVRSTYDYTILVENMSELYSTHLNAKKK